MNLVGEMFGRSTQSRRGRPAFGILFRWKNGEKIITFYFLKDEFKYNELS